MKDKKLLEQAINCRTAEEIRGLIQKEIAKLNDEALKEVAGGITPADVYRAGGAKHLLMPKLHSR